VTVLSDAEWTAIASLSARRLRCLQRPPSFDCGRNYPPRTWRSEFVPGRT